MDLTNVEPDFIVEDSKHGSKARVYYSDDLFHEIHYFDSDGNRFYHEKIREPFEYVQNLALKWAEGKRNLVGEKL